MLSASCPRVTPFVNQISFHIANESNGPAEASGAKFQEVKGEIAQGVAAEFSEGIEISCFRHVVFLFS